MRGIEEAQDGLFSFVSLEERVPADHPLRAIRAMVDRALSELHERLTQQYAGGGRPSIPPEQLLRASLLQILYSIRSERLLVEQLDYNLLFRWFVGLTIEAPVWNHSTFSKNRERIFTTELAAAFLERIVAQARAAKLLSGEHFSVDGTLIQAWASQKSFRPRGEKELGPPEGGGRNPTVDYKGTPRSNATHASTSDPDARLYRKGKGCEAKLGYLGHVLMENRHGLVVGAEVTQATGTAEREAAVRMVTEVPGSQRLTLGGDKGYDTAEFVQDLRARCVTPHVAQNTARSGGSALDRRTTRHPGYEVSQKKRKVIEEIFGWSKTVGLIRQVKLRGVERIGALFSLHAAAYDLVRMRNLLHAPPRGRPEPLPLFA
jgi:transposase